MKFPLPLIDAVFLKRYKRFFADVLLDSGEVITVHCPNTGSMKTCMGEGWRTKISDSQNPKRKLRYTLERVHNGCSWIGVNPGLANTLAMEAIEQGIVTELQGFSEILREQKYGENSRVDILLKDPGLCYVEVKSVSMAEGEHFLFPDAVTSRGLKHLQDLLEVKKQGHRAVLLLVIQRRDGKTFRPAFEVDPAWSEALLQVMEQGVEVYPYLCRFTSQGQHLEKTIKISFK